jgi:DNA polymerase-3 subunit epsilon/ATP-dependent DNA helicase DinG
MRGELVALDLETTGVDPLADAIIEIGAVRLREGEIVSEFSSLVNPGIPIPVHVTHLTGIRSEDVIGAPDIKTALLQIKNFCGDAPIIGHNVTFDISFFRPHGLFQENQRIDTYDLAAVLLPSAPRYNLNSLTSELGIELEHAHRALDDARACALLYWTLWNKALSLPYSTLYEITRASVGMSWDTAAVFEAALREIGHQGDFTNSTSEFFNVFSPLMDTEHTLRQNELATKLDGDIVGKYLDEGGALSQNLTGYEHRPQQVEMALAIVQAFNESKHLLVEAGTGIGKSIAYLIPSILWSTQNSQRVVISTNTINLQDQLIKQDIPLVKVALETLFQACVMKGRSNYLCPRRLIALQRRHPTNLDELRTMSKILVWLLESQTGDKSEISLRGAAEHTTWHRLSAQDEGCTLHRCETTMAGACPFYKARKAADAAHVLVVNHALLVSDAFAENRVLPEYHHAIVDEAHQLEDAVTNGLSFRFDRATLQRRLADLGTPSKGLLGELIASAKNRIPEKRNKNLIVGIEVISSTTSSMAVHVEALFKTIYSFLTDNKPNQSGEFVSQLLINPQERSKPSFAPVYAAWEVLREFFEGLALALVNLSEYLSSLSGFGIPGHDDILNSIIAAAQYLDEVRRQLNGFIAAPDANIIYWIGAGQNGIDGVSINAAPLHVGPMIEQTLWQQNATVVMTSATLRTNDSFDYLRERLYAEDVETLEVGSPFDYHESTLLFIPDDIPEPTSRHAYQQSIERGIIELAAALNGRVLALFTSYAQLRQTAQAIAPRLALGNITVYDQSDGSSRQALLEGFKSAEKAVLLGTRSFWEGIDIPGSSLSALVIVRLPFAVPTDPIFAARSETYNNSFNDYAVPDAILRFRQGFGRLIRSRGDRGVVTIFDSRILTKSYGAAFLEALPNCTTQYGPLQLLPQAAQNWLHRT